MQDEEDKTVEIVEIAESAVAGVAAALTATFILGIASWLRRCWLKHRDVKYVRSLLFEGQARVLEANETFHENVDATSSADVLRAAQYNNMVEKLRVALERWVMNLSHAQRRAVYDALDWFHTDSLYAVSVNGQMQYVHLPPGRWPTKEMSIEAAREKFEKLHAVKWLKLPSEKVRWKS